MTTRSLLAGLLLLLASPLPAAQQLKYADFDASGGGNLGTLADPWEDCATVIANIAPGDHVKIKRTAARDSGTCAFSTAATDDPIILEGYKTTPGDLTTFGDGGDDGWNNAYWTSGQWRVGAGYKVYFFDIEGTTSAAGGYHLLSNGASQWEAHYVRIKPLRTDATVCAVDLDDEGRIFNSDVYAPQGQCGIDLNDAGYAEGNIVDITASGATGGIRFNCNLGQYATAIGNIIVGTGKAGKGIFCDTFNDATLSKIGTFDGNSIYNVDVAISFAGIATAGNDRIELVLNNTAFECNTGIENLGAHTAGALVAYNALGCTTNYSGWGDQATSIGAVTLSFNPWNDPDNLDFRPNNTAGGGALIRDAGLRDLELGTRHLGAVQTLAAAASGGEGMRLWMIYLLRGE